MQICADTGSERIITSMTMKTTTQNFHEEKWLGGGFRYFSIVFFPCSPQNLGKWNPFWRLFLIFFIHGLGITNHLACKARHLLGMMPGNLGWVEGFDVSWNYQPNNHWNLRKTGVWLCKSPPVLRSRLILRAGFVSPTGDFLKLWRPKNSQLKSCITSDSCILTMEDLLWFYYVSITAILVMRIALCCGRCDHQDIMFVSFPFQGSWTLEAIPSMGRTVKNGLHGWLIFMANSYILSLYTYLNPPRVWNLGPKKPPKFQKQTFLGGFFGKYYIAFLNGSVMDLWPSPSLTKAEVWPSRAHLCLGSFAGMPQPGEAERRGWLFQRRPMPMICWCVLMFWCVVFFLGGGTPVQFNMFGCSKFKLNPFFLNIEIRNTNIVRSTIHMETTCVM